jgi:hypothetical protein
MNGSTTYKNKIIDQNGESSFDLEAMVAEAKMFLPKEVDEAIIRRTLIEILSSYKNAPIQTYIPIIASKEAVELLKNQEKLPHFPYSAPASLETQASIIK